MAYKKETQYVPVGRGDYVVICREWTIIKDDGVEISRTKKEHVINPDSDWSSEAKSVKAVCDVHFTDAIKKEFAKLSDNEKIRFRLGGNNY